MTKYDYDYEIIRDAQDADAQNKPDRRQKNFSLQKLNPTFLKSIIPTIAGWALKSFGLKLLQKYRPVAKLGRITFVTRYEDVIAILKDPKSFNVPFGPEMQEMAGGTVFALGDDGDIHTSQTAFMSKAMKQICIDRDIRPITRNVSRALLADAGGDIDVARDLFMRVTSETCLAAFGLKNTDAADFADFSASCSALIFGDPGGKPYVREQAMIGAKRKREILDANIRAYANLSTAERTNFQNKRVLHTMVDLVMASSKSPDRLDAESHSLVRTMLFGIITGFVPTAALGAGKLMDHLRQNPSQFHQGIRLARAAEGLQDTSEGPAAKQELEDFLMEVARFNPSLFPGQFRLRNKGADESTLPAHLREIEDGTTIMVSSAAALHDPRVMAYPHRFTPGKGYQMINGDTAPNLTFGLGIHHCFGEGIARAMLTESIQLLLSQDDIAFENKRPKFVGPYLNKMRMHYTVTEGHRVQTMMNALLPLAKNADGNALIAALEGMQGDYTNATPLKVALTNSGIVHFASLNPVNLDDDSDVTDPPTHLMVELNMDGTLKSALSQLRDVSGDAFDGLLPFLKGGGYISFLELVRRNVLEFRTLPWGTIGVNFGGTTDMSVRQIEQEKRLYEFVEEKLLKGDAYGKTGLDKTAAIETIRAEIMADPDDEFAQLMFRPADRFPAFSRHKDKTFNDFWVSYLSQKTFVGIALAFLAAVLIIPIVVAAKVQPWLYFDTYVTVWMFPILLVALITIGFVFVLRRHEHKEIPNDHFAEHDYIAALQKMEDLPQYSQSHITSVSSMKPGLFRRITTALAFHLIGQMPVHWFRPGFITDFATIHYARWVKPKGCNKLIFQSNYDGSWESYLEDFITKVHRGQTAAWNNCKGFPKTNWYSFDGASDGDHFKRWVRRQQIVTRFWYSRFPDMTTGMIRTNALVRDGLARACSFDEHRAWVDLFTMTPRPEDAIETDQVQTLLFHGLGRHPVMTARTLQFNDPEAAKAWVGKLVNDSRNAEERGTSTKMHLSFGDSYPNFPPSFLALSAEGLRTLGMPDAPFDGLTTMPHSFVDSMHNRGRILGQADTPADPTGWRWSDGSAHEDGTRHALLLSYARNVPEMDELNADISLDLKAMNITCSETLVADQSRRGKKHSDGFGFKDGISQPIMRGTQSFAAGKASKDDIVGPGEFILGYPDSRGYLPLNITVSDSTTASSLLPATTPAVTDLVPSFGRKEVGDTRDFGRNGSFLAVQQIMHNDGVFKDFVAREAAELRPELDGSSGSGTGSFAFTKPSMSEGKWETLYIASDEDDADGPLDTLTSNKDIDLMGANTTDITTSDQSEFPAKGIFEPGPVGPQALRIWSEQWVAAKMMGRWQDGSSLARHPSVSKTVRNRARFHNMVNARLSLMLRQSGANSLWDDKRSYVQDFQNALGRVGTVREDDTDTLSMDNTIWSQDQWRVFMHALDKFETEFRPLDLPRRLLQPVRPDNDFRHGTDDPQGLYCPVGSHIRRANPRDSFRPGHEITLEINNRHRLLRRGRTYTQTVEEDMPDLRAEKWHYQPKEGGPFKEEGTFFMCFNANLERQFEFVQQTWIDSNFFHGGRHGPDPIVSQKSPGDRFIIPGAGKSASLDMCPMAKSGDTKNPMDFTRAVAGGYFFMPSRQALLYLSKV